MRKKLFVLAGIPFLFLACSEKTYKTMYDEQFSLFDSTAHTSAERDNQAINNGENPMRRPSYDEYRAK